MTKHTKDSKTDILSKFVKRGELQNILNNLLGSCNKLDASNWRFEGPSDNFTLDTTALKTLSGSHPHWSERIVICPVWLAKIMFLYSNQGKRSVTIYRASFDFICKTIFYLAEHDLLQISKNELENYIIYLLMNSLEKGKPNKRLIPLSYRNFCNGLDIVSWVKTLKRTNLENIGFSSTISDVAITRAVKVAIETISSGDLTYRDWVDGGSFNHLTLDYGCYYIEHCTDFFNQHISLATALRLTLANISDIATKAGLLQNQKTLKSFTKPIIANFLMGKTVSELQPTYRFKLRDELLNRLQQETIKLFKDYLRLLLVWDALLSKDEINKIAAAIGFCAQNTIQYEWLRLIIEVRLNLKYRLVRKTTRNKLALDKQWLIDTVESEINLETLNTAVEVAEQRLNADVDVSLPSIDVFQAIGIKPNNSCGSTYLNEFLRRVEDAGVIQFVALTGWRESEYGFSLSDIYVNVNHDLLDQKNCPFRYEVKWFVPKTNGKTKLQREITHSAYCIALQLAQLVQAGDNKPCLYSFTKGTKNHRISKEQIKDAVASMWLHYAHHYHAFIKLDKLKLLNKLSTKSNTVELSVKEKTKLKHLLRQRKEEHWEQLEKDSQLREAHRRTSSELPRVQFFLESDDRTKVAWNYREDNLKYKYLSLLNKYLSEKTKTSIMALNSEDQITKSYNRSVVNEIISDSMYPTPHAFRHMWAEAVYRRFDGDAGWIIRSNFKHISQNMWLAYIRNKDNRRQHDRVKRRVISSLLSNYLHKSGQGYAGATDKLLRRLFLKTKVMELDNIDAVVREFSLKEIEDIKATPWGYCLLRHRNQHRAKCAEDGVPQRYNASVALCSGCMNYLAQEGNIEGILLNIANDLKVLHKPKIPECFRKVSYDTVRNALINLKKLDVEDEILDDLQTALSVGRERRAS